MNDPVNLNKLPTALLRKIAVEADITGALELDATVKDALLDDAEREDLKAKAAEMEDALNGYLEALRDFTKAVGWSGQTHMPKPEPWWVDMYMDAESTLRWLAGMEWEENDGGGEPLIDGTYLWEETATYFDEFLSRTLHPFSTYVLRVELGISLSGRDDSCTSDRDADMASWQTEWQAPICNALYHAVHAPSGANLERLEDAAEAMSRMAVKIVAFKTEVDKHREFVSRFMRH